LPKQRGAIAKPRVGRAFCGLPWEGIDDAINPEWVAFVFNPFRVDMKWNPLPRVERHNAPLNPGLRDEAPLGLSEPETHAVTAEPFRPARGGGLP